MLIPTVCINCGCSIGDKEDLFLAMREERVREVLGERDTTAAQAAVDAGIRIDCGDILDTLGIHRPCCRTHAVTSMGFCDVY